MTNAEAISFVKNTKKGRIHTFLYRTAVKLATKYVGYTLEKESRIQGMLGDYGNRKAVIEKRENGQAKGICHLKEIEKDVLFENKEGEMIIRVLPVASGNGYKEYFLNGKPTTVEELAKIFPKSYYESGNKEKPDCVSLKVKNIKKIN